MSITGSDISAMFAGLTRNTVNIVLGGLRNEFIAAVDNINKLGGEISPKPNMIMNAFRLCPIEKTRVVILGQDPYIRPGQAIGLSFSVPRDVKLPPSLVNIYAALVESKLIDAAPTHGDLTSWAAQGVLMFNTALTTKMGKSNAHQAIWSTYSRKLITAIAEYNREIVFVLFGGDAKSRAPLVVPNPTLEWGHPSPLNADNRGDKPSHFRYCTAFSRIKAIYPDINWASVCDTAADAPTADNVTDDNINGPADSEGAEKKYINGPFGDDAGGGSAADSEGAEKKYIFTDGGATGNGKAHCKASWAAYFVGGGSTSLQSGLVDGSIVPPSNNRGELTAILTALQTAQNNPAWKRVYIVSDSEYSIKCISQYAKNWLAKNKMDGKKNVDLIIPAYEIWKTGRFEFIHVNSHKNPPSDRKSEAWFMWNGNDIADRECQRLLA